MPLLLVRHAHAGRRSAYRGDDRQRPLSKRGMAQAMALVPVLVAYRPARVLSSPSVRCSETVRPTADALSLAVETVDELAEGHEAETVLMVRRMAGEPAEPGQPAGASAVLCTHGDGASALLDWLQSTGGAPPGQARLQKGDAWVLGLRGPSLAIVDHIRLSTRAVG